MVNSAMPSYIRRLLFAAALALLPGSASALTLSLQGFQTTLDGVTALPGGPAKGTFVISASNLPHGKFTTLNWSVTLGTHTMSSGVAVSPQAVGGDTIATKTIVLNVALAALTGCVIWADESASGSATIGGITIAWSLT